MDTYTTHIGLAGGDVIEVREPRLTVDFGGLPRHIGEDEALAAVCGCYHDAQRAYARGNRRLAAEFLSDMGRASGHYGLASATEFYASGT